MEIRVLVRVSFRVWVRFLVMVKVGARFRVNVGLISNVNLELVHFIQGTLLAIRVQKVKVRVSVKS